MKEKNVIKSFMAKSYNLGGQDLFTHSIECAKACFTKLSQENLNPHILANATIGCLFHDIGKISSYFQNKLKNIEQEEKDYFHNIISAELFHCYVKISNDNEFIHKDLLTKAIYFHHVVSEDNNHILSFDDLYNTLGDEIEIAKSFMKVLADFFNTNFNSNIKVEIMDEPSMRVLNIDCLYLPIKSLTSNNHLLGVYHNAIRSCDSLVSKGLKDFNQIFSPKIFNGDFVKPAEYDDRFYVQKEVADESTRYNFYCIDAMPSLGKSLIAILSGIRKGKRTIFCAPTNATAKNSYNTIVRELKINKLENYNVALLLTNNFIYGDENADIIVTNIDNYARPSFKSDKSIMGIEYLTSTLIIDEMHEYISNSAIMAYLVNLLRIRSLFPNSTTILMSGTINYNLLNVINDLKDIKSINVNGDYFYKYRYIPNENIGNRQFRIIFSDGITTDLTNKNTLAVVNTVAKAQEIFKNKLVDNIIHSRYFDKDLDNKESLLYKEHGKNTNSASSWVSTCIISTGLDISFDKISILWPSPDRAPQAMGRCNRWGMAKEIPTVEFAFDGFADKSECRGVDTFFDAKMASNYFIFLKENIENNSIVTYNRIMDLRKEFFEKYSKEYKKFFDSKLVNSFKSLSLIRYDKTFKIGNTDTTYISHKANLRTENMIFQFFIKVKNDKTNEYYEEPIQVDNRIIKEDFLSDRTNIENAYKLLKDNKNYFKNKKQAENLLKKGDKFFIEKLMKLSNCSNTPFPITYRYFYNENIGLYDSNSK